MLGRITGAVRFKEPLCYHTSLRIGGPVEVLVTAQDIDDVRYALRFADQEDLPLCVIGGGNNVLVADRGLQAVALKLDGVLSRLQFDGNEVIAGGGSGLSMLVREAAGRGLCGLEPLVGMPGTVGGTLREVDTPESRALWSRCTAVYYVAADGTTGEWRAASAPPAGTLEGIILLGCRLRLATGEPAAIQADVQRRIKAKRSSHPFALASAGAVWKDPEGTSAIALIESSGLRCRRVNAVELSAKCPTFVVNRGGGTAVDVLALMELVHDAVERRAGVNLEPAVRLLGIEAPWTERSLVAAGH